MKNLKCLLAAIIVLQAVITNAQVGIATNSPTSTLDVNGSFGIKITAVTSGTAVGTGNQNTIDIVTGCADAGTAARICSDLVLNGYSDWYLPSKDELNLLYTNHVAIGGFVVGDYWTSTEVNSTNAWYQGFGDGPNGISDRSFFTILM